MTFYATVQHNIRNGDGEVMHTIRHSADERCNYCIIIDGTGEPKVFKVLIALNKNYSFKGEKD